MSLAWLILYNFPLLFAQSKTTNETSRTSRDFSSSRSSTLPAPAKAANLARSTSAQTLPSPTKKRSLPRRGITFADLPPSLKASSLDCDEPPTAPSTTHEQRQTQPLQDTSTPLLASSQIPAHARFQLPPTPLTAPECGEDVDASAFFSERQIARSVDGQSRVEVGLRGMSNYFHTNVILLSIYFLHGYSSQSNANVKEKRFVKRSLLHIQIVIFFRLCTINLVGFKSYLQNKKYIFLGYQRLCARVFTGLKWKKIYLYINLTLQLCFTFKL